MFTHFKVIDEQIFASIYEHEEQQLIEFKSKIDCMFLNVSKLHGLNYTVRIHRWTDTAERWFRKPFDGYTATLQVDFTDNNGNVIELDESVCSFFENITYIVFDPIGSKYRVFQNEELRDIQADINQFICNIDISN